MYILQLLTVPVERIPSKSKNDHFIMTSMFDQLAILRGENTLLPTVAALRPPLEFTV